MLVFIGNFPCTHVSVKVFLHHFVLLELATSSLSANIKLFSKISQPEMGKEYNSHIWIVWEGE